MNFLIFKQDIRRQLIISNLSVILVSFICFLSSDFIGYRSVALLLLATVSINAIFFKLYPVLVAATLSALIWDFFFIPPHFTFHVEKSEDVLMLMMYFIIALINGAFTFKIRQYEKNELQKEERQNSLKLYKTLFDSISHELRTPIATIIGVSDNLLQNNNNLTEKNKTFLVSEVSIAGFRLNRLVDNLLNMQRVESGLLKAKLDWCDINELINMPLNRLKTELAQHTIIIDIQPNFPLIKLDFGLTEQAIFNLLHNASLYTPPNTRININATFTDKYLILEISDNAEGFSEETLKNIFTKFYRNDKKNKSGIGLGLSIVKGFIEAQNGKITATNNYPKGAKFIINIETSFYQIDNQTNEQLQKNES